MQKGGKSEFSFVLIQIGNRIKEIRQKAGKTQEDMAEAPYPIELRNYQRIEAGEQNITVKTLFKLAKKLNCKMTDIISV
ncbi:MAG: helix-turn-helix domain-containing protein [Spirochaetota bacterium]